MERTIYNFSCIDLYMNSTIHISPVLMSGGLREGGGSDGDCADNDGDGGDGVPTTLPSGQTPKPSRPGTKYPARGIPHFDQLVKKLECTNVNNFSLITRSVALDALKNCSIF